MLKEVVDNAEDKYIMGHGKKVETKIDGTRVAVLRPPHSNGFANVRCLRTVRTT